MDNSWPLRSGIARGQQHNKYYTYHNAPYKLTLPLTVGATEAERCSPNIENVHVAVTAPMDPSSNGKGHLHSGLWCLQYLLHHPLSLRYWPQKISKHDYGMCTVSAAPMRMLKIMEEVGMLQDRLNQGEEATLSHPLDASWIEFQVQSIVWIVPSMS